jgi:transcription initiation factor TFIID TATA-box-binding protein
MDKTALTWTYPIICFLTVKMRVTNVVCQARWSTAIDLTKLASQIESAKYDPGRFSGVIWKQRDIGGNCLVFANGKVICAGAKSIEHGLNMLGEYTHLLQTVVPEAVLKEFRMVTQSACHKLSGPVDFGMLCSLLGANYEPELFNAAMLRREGVHYSIFQSGSVVITGMKDDELIYPVLLELELCVKS